MEEAEDYAAFTLMPSTYVHAAVTGSFTEPGVEEVAIVRGAGILETARLGPAGNLETQVVKKTFSTIRSIQPFRPVGLSKDLLLLGSDSGVVTLVEVKKEGQIKTVAQLRCGPPGFRRDVPGEYVAADPSGRAIMAVSVDGHKVVATVVVEEDGQVSVRKPAKFCCRMGTGGSGKPAVVYSVVGLEVGAEAPSFAVLAANDGAGDQELDDPEDKKLTVYRLDMEKNEVTQLWRQPASRTGAMLAPVPFSGASVTRPVLVLSENWVAYKDQKRREIRVPLPRRAGLPRDMGVLPVAASLVRPAGKEGGWVLLVQSEMGDVYSVSLKEEGGEQAVLCVTVLDTIPRSTALVVLAGGKVLWAASEFGNQAVYGLTSLVGEGVSSRSLRDSDPHHLIGDGSREAAVVAEVFEPSPMLTCLKEVQTVNNTAPVTYLRSVAGRLVAFCGGGRASSMRVFTSGLPVTADPAGALPPGSKAGGMWTAMVSDEQYLLVSFERSTGVWQLATGPDGEMRFKSLSKEESDAVGFVADAKTVEVGALEDSAGTSVQVLEDSRFRRLGISSAEWEWRVPGRRLVGRAAMGRQCLVLACGGTELYCFRFPGARAEMVTYEPHDMMVDISAVAVSTRTGDGQHGEPLVFAACLDLSLHVLGYGEDGQYMVEKGRVTLPDRAECLHQLPDGTLVVGLVSGALIRARLSTEGRGGLKLTLGRVTQVGAAPLRLFKLRAAGDEAVLAVSGSMSLLLYAYSGRVFEHNLAYSTPIHLATPFQAPENPECVLALHGSQLSILQVEGYGAPFSERSLALSGTPRGVAPVPQPPHLLVVLESDDGGSPGVRIVDPVTCSSRQRIELRPNDLPLSLIALRFRSSSSAYGGGAAQAPLPAFVCVGGVTLGGEGGGGGKGWIDVYAVSERGLQWQHRTTLDDHPASALAALSDDGLLVVGTGPAVRVFDYNSSVKRLFRRCEYKLPVGGPVTRLLQRGSLVVASDILRGVHVLQLNRTDSSLVLVAQDRVPRLVTDICLHCSPRQPLCIAGADKLGNLFFLRLPSAKAWPTGGGDPLSELGQPRELEAVLEYHVGEVVTSITTVKLGAQATREALAYATVTGAVGVLVPLSHKEADMFGSVETALRKQPGLSPTASDHLLYRSPLAPAKGVVDLDFCEEAGSAVRAMATRDAKVDRKELERRMAELLGQVSQVMPD